MAVKKKPTNWKGLKPNPHDYFGFIYIVHNTLNDKLYIGRKQYHRFSKRKKVGQSDWKTYKGSSRNLHHDIKKFGEDVFNFYIIGHAETRGGLVYAESNLQHKFDVLTDKDKYGQRKWLNGQIGSTKFIPAETIVTRIPKSIKDIMKRS